MRPFALTALFAALAILPALAEDKAEIKLGVKKGTKFTRTTEIKGEGDCKIDIGGGGGMSLAMKAELTNESKQIEEVLDVKDGVPVDIHRAYPSRKSSVNLGMYGQQEQAHPLEGADITCKGGVWAVAAGGSGEEAAKVIGREKAADPLGAAIASGKVVTVGNTWDADKDKVKAWFESEFANFEAAEAEMECKLGEFREKDGRKCARIEVKAKVKGKISLQGAPASEVTLTMEGDVFFALDIGMVILVKGKGSMKAEIEIQGDQSGTMNLDVPLEWNVGVKVGEADFGAKPSGEKPVAPPKREKPEYFPPPVR